MSKPTEDDYAMMLKRLLRAIRCSGHAIPAWISPKLLADAHDLLKRGDKFQTCRENRA